MEDTVAPQRQPQERAIAAQRSAQLLSTNITDRVIADEVGEEGEGGRGGGEMAKCIRDCQVVHLSPSPCVNSPQVECFECLVFDEGLCNADGSLVSDATPTGVEVAQ